MSISTTSVTRVQHLGQIRLGSIVKIRAVDHNLLCDEMRERGEIEHFLNRYGHLMMAWNSERANWRLAQRGSKFREITVITNSNAG